MALDPFAPAVDEAQNETTKENVTVTPEVATNDNGHVTLTFKSGGGFADPWIVIHATDVADAYDQVSGENASTLAKLMDATAKAAKYFAGQSISPAQAPRGGGSAPAAKPAPAQTAPAKAGDPECPEGWTYKTGSKNGKTWRAYMPPQGSGESPMWLK